LVHQFQKGDKVGVYVDFFGGYVPAEVKSVDRNLLNVNTEKQSFTVEEKNAVPLKLLPRVEKRKLVYRISERLK